MRHEDRDRIVHMLEAIDAAMSFVAGRTRGELEQDRMLLFAVLRALEVLGEAASKVSEETRLAATHIPWVSMVSMRNRLIHGYFDVDPDIVWRTVAEELPPLVAPLRELT